VANHESAKLKWSLYVNIIHEEEEDFGGGEGGKRIRWRERRMRCRRKGSRKTRRKWSM
jgi:hypothetical protein